MRISDYTLKVLAELGDKLAFEVLKYKFHNGGFVFYADGMIYSIHGRS